MPTPRIEVHQDIQKDAWNWWHACNKISYSTDWRQRTAKKIQNKLAGKTKKQAFVFLLPFLKKQYAKIGIKEKENEVRSILLRHEREIFSRMEKVTERKIYRNTFTCFVTTFPRAPYDYHRGYVWLPVVWPKETYVRTFVHELLHFQTYAYWQERCLKKLNQKEFENLKEALTVILNEEFMDLIVWPDKGYEMHKKLREKLLEAWRANKNFDALITYGIRLHASERHTP